MYDTRYTYVIIARFLIEREGGKGGGYLVRKDSSHVQGKNLLVVALIYIIVASVVHVPNCFFRAPYYCYEIEILFFHSLIRSCLRACPLPAN